MIARFSFARCRRTALRWFAVIGLLFVPFLSAAATLGDLNGDGRVNAQDLAILQELLSGTAPLTLPLQSAADVNQDGLVSALDLDAIADIILEARALQEIPPPGVLQTSPVLGEGNVSLTRETVIRLNQPLAATNIIRTNTLFAEFGGRRILSRTELALDRRALTLFYLEPLPASARVRVTINGDSLTGLFGVALDADGDGVPGGSGSIEFDTASISAVPGTAVIGTVYASELVPDPNDLTNSINVPLAGVTITVDGAEQTLRTVTDTNGFFSLSPCPAGRFFVHVDGRTVTNLAAGIRYPDLAYYPFVGKAWEAVAGYTNNLAGGNGLIYLPLIRQGTLQTVSQISNTIVTFPPGVVASNPALAGVAIAVPPGALYDDGGQRGGKVGIAPVAPNRLPEPLPPGLNLPLVITVQTDGPSNFGEPLPACFPNLPDPVTGVLLLPGAKTALWSFNHDTGRWEIQGPMTVTADGQFACTDPGVGIRQPGWHGAQPGTQGGGGTNEGWWPPEPPPTGKGQQSSAAPSANSDSSCQEHQPPVPGDPVHLFSGEFYHTEEDMRIKGVGLDFRWVRKFQSVRIDRQAPLLPFGPRWTHSYAIRLQFNFVRSDEYNSFCDGGCGGLARIRQEGSVGRLSLAAAQAGAIVCMPPPPVLRSVSVIDGNGRADEYVGPRFYPGDLNSGSTSEVFRARGLFRELARVDTDTWALTFEDRGKWLFSRSRGYQITRIEDRYGNHIDFDYENYRTADRPMYRLHTITDTLGRVITLSYNQAGRIASITDFSGRSVRYEYYDQTDGAGFPGFLKSVISPAVTGSANGNDFVNGKKRTYTYSDGPNYVAGYYAGGSCGEVIPFSTSFIGIQAITDGRNNDPNDPRFGQGAYLTNYYATSGLQAGSRFIQLTQTVTGDQWLQVPRLRLVRQTWGGQDLSFTYEQHGSPSTYQGRPALHVPDGLLVTARDRNGNVKDYVYDQYNQCRTFREYSGRAPAAGAVTQAANRPTAKVRDSDPPVFETKYVYNGQFQQSLINHPNGNQSASHYREGSGRAAGNLLAIAKSPGLHLPSGDQPELVRRFEYDTDFNSCCGFNFATKITDARGNSITNGYDGLGNLTRRRFQIDNVFEDFSYNSRGQLTQRIHPDNGSGHRRVDRYVYYASGPMNGYLRHAIIDATGFALTNTFEYDARGNVTRWIDPRGKDTQYIVNQLDQVVRQISREVRDGTGIRYQKDYYYDANNNVTLVDVQNLDENGVLLPNTHFTTTYEYDLLNYMTRKTEEVEPGQFIVTEYAYDGNRNLTEIRKGEATAGRQPANIVRFEYDERDLLFREIRAPGTPEQSTTQYDYDGNKNLIRVIQGLEAASHITELTYDGYDRLVAVRDPMGNETLFNYDENGNLVRRRVNGEVVDLAGNANNVRLSDVQYEYDPMNRLIRQDKDFFETTSQLPIASGQATTRIEYSGTSQIIRLVNANGHTNTIAYDTANRRRTLTDAAGNTITLSYDRNGNIDTATEVEKPDLGGPDEVFTTRFLYDNLNRLTAAIDNVGTSNRFAYDSRNNRTLHINGRGNAVRYTYDGLNREIDTIRYLTDTGDGSGNVLDTIITRKAWDDSSRLISQTDDNTNSTVYTYDALDRKVATTYADGTVHYTAFDAHDNPVVTLDANGTYVTNRFDDRDRLVRRDVAVGPGVSDDTTFENYRYDGLSRLVWAEDNDSTVQMEYDSLSRVLRDIQNGTVVASTYDPMGNMTALFYPSGRVVTNAFDVLERLKTVSDADGLVARYDYVGPWRVKQRDYGNGTRMTYEYHGVTGVPNPAGDFGVKQVTRTTHSLIATGVPFDDRVYRWDRAGNKTVHNELHTGGSAKAYSYDSVDRLIRSVKTPASGPVEDIRYFLDGVGNRTQVIGGPDAGIYTMSSAGPEPADRQVNQYTTTPFGTEAHDRNGNLIANNSGQPNQRLLSYDFRNRMVGAVVQDKGATASYAYDALGRRIGKQVAGGTPLQMGFVHSGWRVVEERTAGNATAATYVHGGYIDEVLEMRRGAQRHYYHSDAQFSVTALSSGAGAIVEQNTYSDFGLPSQVGGGSFGSVSGNPFSFTGREFESQTRLLHLRLRHKDPTLGRFLVPDLLGRWTDQGNFGNGLAYVGGNPATFVDPFGLYRMSCGEEMPVPGDRDMKPSGNLGWDGNPYSGTEAPPGLPDPLGQIEKVKGDVRVERPGVGEIPAIPGMRLYEGDTVVTGEKSSVRIQEFEPSPRGINESVVINDTSRFYIKSKSSDQKRTEQEQQNRKGRPYPGEGENPFKIRTPGCCDSGWHRG
jgi:RHS repeat-associated protein